jgi:hypothetical protein
MKKEERGNKEQKQQQNKEEKQNRRLPRVFQAVIPIIQEIWTDICINRNTPVVGERIVAEYDSLSKKAAQLYMMKDMVLPEDEMKIFNETLEIMERYKQ